MRKLISISNKNENVNVAYSLDYAQSTEYIPCGYENSCKFTCIIFIKIRKCGKIGYMDKRGETS
jgi:uncharacterized membrane protein YhdT